VVDVVDFLPTVAADEYGAKQVDFVDASCNCLFGEAQLRLHSRHSSFPRRHETYAKCSRFRKNDRGPSTDDDAPAMGCQRQLSLDQPTAKLSTSDRLGPEEGLKPFGDSICAVLVQELHLQASLLRNVFKKFAVVHWPIEL
jgi:hypothetical protein